MIFAFLFVAGAVGIFAMTLLGVLGSGHGGHGAHTGGHAIHHGYTGNLHGHGAALGHGAHSHGLSHVGGHGNAVARTNTSSGESKGSPALVVGGRSGGSGVLRFIPSPLDLFSMAMGAGLVGIITKHLLNEPQRALAAIAGAIVMNFLIIRPMFSLGLRFASKPSEGLEGSIANVAQAITKFDNRGKGLVRLTLDGQVVQLLAQLEPSELTKGVQVRKGDEVIVTQVNAGNNTCCVTREFSL